MSSDSAEPKWYAKLKRSRLGLTAAALGALVVAIATFTDAVEKIAVLVNIKTDPAQANEINRFNSELRGSMWDAYQQAVRLVPDIKNPDEAVREKALKQYEDIAAKFFVVSKQVAPNVERYHGQTKLKELERVVLNFQKIALCATALRYRATMCILDLSGDAASTFDQLLREQHKLISEIAPR